MCRYTPYFIFTLCVPLLGYWYYANFQRTRSPVVITENGSVQGIVSMSRDGLEFDEYLGIPYAKPPTGDRRFEVDEGGPSVEAFHLGRQRLLSELNRQQHFSSRVEMANPIFPNDRQRFRSPEPADSWEGVRDASSFSYPCLQFEFTLTGLTVGSEDCLYLNVFVPKGENKKPLPVMFYIHGGYFHMGTGELGGPKHFMDEDVILVSINYRLGALGFMSTGDNTIKGNMGLKDQHMALNWVQANIKQFGGDPSRVTLFGESAGGVSVHNHMISPKSKGLFWRAICQSGTSTNYWAMQRNVKEQSQRFAQKFDCPIDNPKRMVACLKRVDATTFVQGHFETLDFFRTRISTFAPSIEVIKDRDAFITEEPLEALKRGSFSRVPMMAGYNADEGLLFSAYIIANQTKLNEANDDWNTWAPRVLHYSEDLHNATSKLRKFYFGGDRNLINDTKYSKNFTNLFGDRLFSIQLGESARLQSKFVPVHMYYFEYKAEFSLGTLLASSQGTFHVAINYLGNRLKTLFYRHVMNQELPNLGTCHGDEMRMLLSGKWIEDKILINKYRDYEMSKDMVKLWADFAKGVKPLKFRNIDWPPLTETSRKYLRISTDPAVIDEPIRDRVKFWEDLDLRY